MNEINLLDPPPVIWPLMVLLCALLVLRQIRNDLSPIFRGMTDTLAKQAQRSAMAWAMGMAYAAAASLQSLGEVATSLHWVYVAAAAKVLQPGIVAIIAYVNRSPSETAAAGARPTANSTVSAAPFPLPAAGPAAANPNPTVNPPA